MKRIIQKWLPLTQYILILFLLLYGCPNLYYESIGLFVPKSITAVLVVAIYVVSHLFVYTNSVLKKSPWSGCICLLLIIETFGIILFAQKHLIITAVLTFVILSVEAFIFASFFRRCKLKTKKAVKSCFIKARGLTSLLLIAVIAVPAVMGIWSEASAKSSAIAAYKAVVEDYLSLNINEDDDDFLIKHKKIVEKLSMWSELSSEDKADTIYEVGLIELNYLGLPDVSSFEVISEKVNGGTAGNYSNSNHRITINYYYMNENNAQKNLLVILHESFHAYQHYVLETLDFDSDDVAHGYYYKQAREWNTNTECYVNGIVDFELYEAQPLERDASAYAEKRIAVYNDAIKALNETEDN